jgi:PAS domain S-box-containing protein
MDVPNEDELVAMLETDEHGMSVVIVNPHEPDQPMIYVSAAFETQTGYAPEEALGRNCRFLQGPETDPDDVEKIRAGLAARRPFTVDILNYRKSGEPFVNRLRIRPIFDENGALMYFVGAQNPL